MPEKMIDESKSHYILGLLLFMTGLLVLLVVVVIRSQADDSSTSVTITNDSPTINTITISTSTEAAYPASFIDLNENTTKMVYVHGQYTDNNGCADVAASGTLAFKFYRSGVGGGSDCSQNDSSCYDQNSTSYNCNPSMASNPCAGGTQISANYECSVPLQFFADATDAGTYNAQNWVALITAYDETSASGSASSTTEINTLTALDVTPSINYGSLSLGATSGYDATSTITNTGNNDALNTDLSGTPMACTVGTIPVANQHYSITGGFTYSGALALSSTPTTYGLSLNKATSVGTPSTKDIYWKIQIPGSGLSGSCSGTTTFSAI